ncbi:hypothetical protein VYU27_010518, partial [Nannochloropsis oceanica]
MASYNREDKILPSSLPPSASSSFRATVAKSQEQARGVLEEKGLPPYLIDAVLTGRISSSLARLIAAPPPSVLPLDDGGGGEGGGGGGGGGPAAAAATGGGKGASNAQRGTDLLKKLLSLSVSDSASSSLPQPPPQQLGVHKERVWQAPLLFERLLSRYQEEK